MTVPVAELNVDPFTRVHRALFEKLAAQPRFAALVKLANRIDYAGGLEDPERGAPAASDLIEATLVPAGATPGTWRTRDTFELELSFVIALDTGSLRVHRAVYPAQWAVLCAMASADDDLGLSFVKRVNVTTLATLRTEEPEAGRQWRGVARIDVLCMFARTAMKGT